MTTQEFVKQEVNKISKESTLHGSKLFADGLTKGLEIAKEYRSWLESYPYSDIHDDDELLTIFLTEKYGK